MFPYEKEEAWLSGYRAELVIKRPRVQVLTCLLAPRITLGGPEIKSLATIVIQPNGLPSTSWNYLFYSS